MHIYFKTAAKKNKTRRWNTRLILIGSEFVILVLSHFEQLYIDC